ncbi:hypothetical protein [Sphingomonas baiyangensis]|nr:hypothetical protein [Sphingomonas baiyangensis]
MRSALTSDLIATDLRGRIAAIDAAADAMEPAALIAALDQLRRHAVRHGRLPAVTVIHAIDAAVARGERGPIVHDWLAILADAACCPTADRGMHETFAAACSVRLAGA